MDRNIDMLIKDEIVDAIEVMVKKIALLQKLVDDTRLDENTKEVFVQLQIYISALATRTPRLQECIRK